MAFTLAQAPVVFDGGSPGAGSTSISFTVTGCTAGNSLVVGVEWVDGSANISSISCTGESNLTVHGTKLSNSGITSAIQLASLAEITSSGSKTITVTLSTSSTYRGAFALELVGGNTASFFDAVTPLSGSGTNPSGSHTTGTANAAIVAIVSDVANTTAAGSGYTFIDMVGDFRDGEYILDAGAAGAKTVDFVAAGSGTWRIQAASFNLVDPNNPIKRPVVGALALTGAAPTVFIPTAITPTVGALTLSGVVPGVFSGQTIVTATGALTLAGLAPNVSKFLTIPAGALTLSGVAPSIPSPPITVPVGALTLTGVAPTIVRSAAPEWAAWTSEGLIIHGSRFSGGPTWKPWTASTTISSPLVLSVSTAWAPWTAQAAFKLAAVVEWKPWTASGRIIEPLRASVSWAPWRSGSISGYAAWKAWTAEARLVITLSEVYTTKVMNTRNTAVTEYTNYAFNSFAKIGDSYYGAGPDGLVRLDGETDRGSNIDWVLKTGQLDDKSTLLKRLPEILASLRSNGPIRVRVYKDDNSYFDYTLQASKLNTINQQRVKIGRGMRSKYYMVEMSGVNNSDLELDSMLINMIDTKRRIG